MYIIVYFFLFYNFYAIIRTGETMRSIKETTTNTIIIKKSEFITTREFDSCLQFFTNQIAQNVDYINAFEFFYCQICENNCTNTG